MTLDSLESIIWSQARNLNSTDPITRATAMDAVRIAIGAYTDDVVVLASTDHPSIVAKRRRALEEAS